MPTSLKRAGAGLTGLAAALVLLVGCGSQGEVDVAETGTGTSAPTTASAPLELALPDAGSAKCMVPSADLLAGADAAFEGTVDSVHGRVATIDVSRWFRPSDATSTEVQVTAPDMGEIALEGITFTVGQTYLVAAREDRVMICGLTSERTGDLAALYDQAFTE